MKRLFGLPQIISVITLVVLPVFLAGCGTIAGRASSTMPDDFYITYETAWHNFDSPVMLLDTKNNIIGTKLGPNDYAFADYYISPEYLQAIYDGIVKYDIKSYSSPNLLKADNIAVTPRVYYKMTFQVNGEIYSVFCDNSVVWQSSEKKFRNLESFKSKILDYYYENADEYKAFPPATALPT